MSSTVRGKQFKKSKTQNSKTLKYKQVQPQHISAKKETYLRESLWVLYSITVVGGRLRTRFRVSRIFPVVIESCAVRFQTDIMSSCNYKVYVQALSSLGQKGDLKYIICSPSCIFSQL